MPCHRVDINDTSTRSSFLREGDARFFCLSWLNGAVEGPSLDLSEDAGMRIVAIPVIASRLGADPDVVGLAGGPCG